MPACGHCGDEFAWERKPGQRGRTALYCSKSCGERARAARRPKPDRPQLTPEELARRAALRSAASAKAASVRWSAASTEERAEAARRAAAARYTDEQREHAAARRAARKARHETPCPYCGDPIGPGRRVQCGKPECARLHHLARCNKRWHLRRAQKLDLPAESFDSREVYERDGWICGLCGKPVPQDATFPAKSSASLDHIMPLSRGGHHVRENTQCSHLGCNMRKGSQVAAA